MLISVYHPYLATNFNLILATNLVHNDTRQIFTCILCLHYGLPYPMVLLPCPCASIKHSVKFYHWSRACKKWFDANPTHTITFVIGSFPYQMNDTRGIILYSWWVLQLHIRLGSFESCRMLSMKHISCMWLSYIFSWYAWILFL